MLTNLSSHSTLNVKFWIAEDIRQEIDNKLSLLGLYVDDVLVVKLPVDAPSFSKENPLLLEGVGILISVRGPVGQYQVKGAFYSGSAKDASNKLGEIREQVMELKPGIKVANIVCRLRPFIAGPLGIKTLFFSVDEQEFTYHFEVRDGRPLLDSRKAKAKSLAAVKTKAKLKR